MDTKFQTSFIPKKPILDSSGSSSKNVSVNMFSLAANLIFAITMIATGGAFFYKNILINQVKSAGVELEAARAAFETEKIKELIDASNRFKSIKEILDNHVVVSELLLLLQDTTVKSIRFTDFSYQNKGSEISLVMNGEAQSFNSLATQSEIFAKTGFILNQSFSDFLLSDNGTIKMKFTSSISKDLISYKKSLESLSLNQ